MFFNDLETAITESFPFKNRVLLQTINRYIQERIGNYLVLTKKFYVENRYIDLHWRAIYRRHFSRTYYEHCDKFATRIHMFQGDVSEDDYLGYLVLRPLPITKALSRIVLKPYSDFFCSNKTYLMTTRVNVSIISLNFYTALDCFPTLVQDGVAQVCAESCMNMAGRYMSRKFPKDFPDYKPDKLFTEGIDRRSIPSFGLSIYEISDIMQKAGYRAYIQKIRSKKEFFEYIDPQIESGLPVIFAYGEHVSVVAGHTFQENKKFYIVFDDSGYHLEKIGHKQKPLFSGTLNLEKIRWETGVYGVFFDFDKVFLRPQIVTALSNKLNFGFDRKFIIEYKLLIKKLNEMGFSVDLINKRNPRYVWFLEGDYGAIIIDAASHIYDYYYSIIGIVNKWKKGAIGLLKPIQGGKKFDEEKKSRRME